MRFDLSAMTTRAGRARHAGVALNVIQPPKTFEGDLARIYMKVLRSVAEWSRDRLLPEFRRALEQGATRDAVLQESWITDDVSDLERDLGGLGAELDRLILTLIPELRDWTIRVERWHRARWGVNVLTATTVDLQTMIGPQDVATTLDAVLARNVALVKDISAQAQGRVADAVWRGFQARTPARQVAKEIDEALGTGRRRALRVAADQTQKLSSDLDAERMRQAGIDRWKWRSSHKVHFRPEHAARDGKIYTDKTAPKDLPGVLPYCGCKRQAVLSFD